MNKDWIKFEGRQVDGNTNKTLISEDKRIERSQEDTQLGLDFTSNTKTNLT